MSLPNELIYALGLMVAASIGFFAAILMTAGKARESERRAWRQAEKLHRDRSIQDMRDSTRLF